jgi:hypothetical protein
VIDVSGSTALSCGIPGNRVLDCEKEAVLSLHAGVETSGPAVDYGLASFAASGGQFRNLKVQLDYGIHYLDGAAGMACLIQAEPSLMYGQYI